MFGFAPNGVYFCGIHTKVLSERMANQWDDKFILSRQAACSTKMISKFADAREREHLDSVVLSYPGPDSLSSV